MTDTGEWTTRRYLSLLGNILIWVIVAIDAFYLWPTQLHGATSMVIVSGRSMEPTYFSGDLVIARKMKPSVGDVIVYAPEGLGGSQIVHRIIGGDATDGWKMQGDNNDFVDPFTPKGSEVRGVVLVHYASFGRVTALLLDPLVWALVLIASIVLLVWWSGDKCEDDPEDKDKTPRDGATEPEAEDELDLIDRMVEGTEAAVSRMVASGVAAGAAAVAPLMRRSPAPRHAAPVSRHGAPALLRGSAIIAVLGLLAVFGPSIASASQLTVNVGGQVSVMTDTKCATQNLVVTPKPTHTGNLYSQVSVAGIAANCLNKPIFVYLHNAAGTNFATFTGTTPATGSTMTLTLSPSGATFDASTVAKVVVKVKGWLFVAAWAYTPPPPAFPLPGHCDGVLLTTGQLVSGTTCTLTYSSSSGFYWIGIYLNVSTNTAFNPNGQNQALTRWRFTLDLNSLTGFLWNQDLNNGFYVYRNNNSNMVVAPGETCSNPASVTFQEDVPGNISSANFIVSAQPVPGMTVSDLICEKP